MAGQIQRCAIADLLNDGRRAALRGAAGLEVDCAAAPRLPVGALAHLGELPASTRLVGVGADAKFALATLGLDRFLTGSQPVPVPHAANGNAFTARVDGGTIVVEVEKKAGDDGRLSQPQTHKWMAGVLADLVAVDFAKLEHVNSSIVAWMLLLVQAAKPAAFELRHVHRQVSTQLTQLRLNHLLTVRPD